MSIQQKQDKIVRAFQALGDWPERYKYIIELGRKLDPIDEKYKVEENLVRGCQSQVWLIADMEGDRVIFKADSDAAITKGLVAMLLKFYSGEEPDTILTTNPEFIDEIGMREHLSPTRSNGLSSMVKQMKIYAMAFKSKQEQAEKAS